MASRPTRRTFCLAAAALAAATAARPAFASTDLARAVKATYLYKLAPFVTWPDAAFPSPTSDFHVCVVGYDEFAALVERAVADLKVGERAFAVRRLASAAQASGCHIVYLGPGGRRTVDSDLETLQGRPVLTVTDEVHAGAARGIVHFVLHEGRVRFEIDLVQAQRHGLAISSRVLELALRVNRADNRGSGRVPT